MKKKKRIVKRRITKDDYELLRVRVSALEKDVSKLKNRDEDLKFEPDSFAFQESTGDG
jgi:hypothetical protein